MKINIPHIAKLANLEITRDQEEVFEKQLSEVLTHIEKLHEVDTTGVHETSQVTGLENIEREDKTTDSFTQEEALSQTKNATNGSFVVKGIFENE
ncbi:MAG: Asp-tRNA(Asn)/Glu-tRNA(Gln) amidotransferase subunit GatC [Candidatus Levybacteria bacterium]|nr:Asp-tRNA(Asn)/Glu-tRNA(Gln) amidotransferase subunit GatC [Candidatus Levybacteria bacterium]